jgi:hypothetical protein
MQIRLGIVGNILAGGSDNAGCPNSRRPKDTAVDQAVVPLPPDFPHLSTPLQGSRRTRSTP